MSTPPTTGAAEGAASTRRCSSSLRRQGLRIACAGIALPNDASVGLHRAAGFELVGTYRSIGWKAGAWRDVAWWQLLLAPGDGEPPREPGPPVRLPGP